MKGKYKRAIQARHLPWDDIETPYGMVQQAMRRPLRDRDDREAVGTGPCSVGSSPIQQLERGVFK